MHPRLQRLCVLAILAIGCEAKQPVPARPSLFTPPDGKFSVQFPEQPQEKDLSLARGVNGKTYELDRGERALLIMYFPLHEDIRENTSLMNQARDNALKAMQGELVQEHDVQVQGFPAKSFLMNLPNGLVERILVLVTETEIYQLIAAVPQGEEHSLVVEEFFGSFKITAPM